jgi:hypothetical protein
MFEIINPLIADSTTAASNATEHLKRSHIESAHSRMTDGLLRGVPHRCAARHGCFGSLRTQLGGSPNAS